jgi:hypothetical protein
MYVHFARLRGESDGASALISEGSFALLVCVNLALVEFIEKLIRNEPTGQIAYPSRNYATALE